MIYIFGDGMFVIICLVFVVSFLFFCFGYFMFVVLVFRWREQDEATKGVVRGLVRDGRFEVSN
jgi:hypothetical protein